MHVSLYEKREELLPSMELEGRKYPYMRFSIWVNRIGDDIWIATEYPEGRTVAMAQRPLASRYEIECMNDDDALRDLLKLRMRQLAFYIKNGTEMPPENKAEEYEEAMRAMEIMEQLR